MNLILLEPGEVRGAGDISLSGTRAAHLLNVLRVAPGHRVRVGILDGPCGVGTVQSVSDDTIELQCSFETTDTRLPTVSIHRRFKVLVEDELDGLFGRGLRLVADPAASRRAGAVVRESVEERVLLAVGPEGGWNDFEVQLLETHGFQPVGMGSRTLRTDTACIALLAVVQDAIRSRT
jgi:16S rRNA U1498 N3-methylase RsmE